MSLSDCCSSRIKAGSAAAASAIKTCGQRARTSLRKMCSASPISRGCFLAAREGKGHEDLAQIHRLVIYSARVGEDSLDFGGGTGFVEAGVDESKHGARGFRLRPTGRQRAGKGGWSIEGDFHLPEAAGKRAHL